jgi:hypothetical protein
VPPTAAVTVGPTLATLAPRNISCSYPAYITSVAFQSGTYLNYIRSLTCSDNTTVPVNVGRIQTSAAATNSTVNSTTGFCARNTTKVGLSSVVSGFALTACGSTAAATRYYGSDAAYNSYTVCGVARKTAGITVGATQSGDAYLVTTLGSTCKYAIPGGQSLYTLHSPMVCTCARF